MVSLTSWTTTSAHGHADENTRRLNTKEHFLTGQRKNNVHIFVTYAIDLATGKRYGTMMMKMKR